MCQHCANCWGYTIVQNRHSSPPAASGSSREEIYYSNDYINKCVIKTSDEDYKGEVQGRANLGLPKEGGTCEMSFSQARAWSCFI